MSAPPEVSAAAMNGDVAGSWLRLYVAGGTPNSARAEQNLRTALGDIDGYAKKLELTIIDVFKQPKRALKDGVIVTPTLIAGSQAQRVVMMGDLTDGAKLETLLRSLVMGR